MPPQKKSRKNVPAQANQDDHHPTQGNETSFVPESSNTTNQERREKLEALMKARAEKTAHAQEQPAEPQEFKNVDDDDTIDRELQMVQQKIQQLQKDKEKFAAQLQAKRKISEKLEQLNKAKEQIEAIQREIDEMKEQENSSLWHESPQQNAGPAREPRKKTSSREMESHTSWIPNHCCQLGCKQHLGRRSLSLSLSPNITASETPDSFS
jgi:DNA repair exonuclease SbcCD ATPase subunit